MTAPGTRASRRIAVNRRARHAYTVLDRIEAGLVLTGTEVKSVRAGHVAMTGSFARVEPAGAVLFHLNIAPYEQGNRFNHDPERPRALLLHRRQVDHLRVQLEQKGNALIPLSIYITARGLVKVELGLCRGKLQHDKRETLRRREADREAARAVARAGRR
jgi:SsrA-binding protein